MLADPKNEDVDVAQLFHGFVDFADSFLPQIRSLMVVIAETGVESEEVARHAQSATRSVVMLVGERSAISRFRLVRQVHYCLA